MDINLLILTFLIIFMLHNLEEIMTIERWFHRTYPRKEERIPMFVKKELEQVKNTTATQFSLVVFILSILASALLFITVTANQYYLFLGLNTIFALNIFTHPLQALFLRSYVPGLWTALFMIIPYNIIAFFQFYNHGILDLTNILKALIVIVIFVPVFIISHKIAEKWVLS